MKLSTSKYQTTDRVPIFNENASVSEAKSSVTSKIADYDTVDYVYVLNQDHKLKGVLSLRKLFLAQDNQKLSEIETREPLITATNVSDLEEIAYLVLTHGIKAIPILDNKGIFTGILPHSVLTQIVYKELRTDILQLTGVHKGHADFDNPFKIPFYMSVRHRIPWLLIGLVGGLAAAQIIGLFEKTLEKSILLAAFIPLVVYIADAVGTQLEAFTIRDFALFRKLNFLKYFFKQFLIVFTLSVLLGGSVAITVFFLYKEIPIAIVLGLAIVSASMSSLFSGLFIPYLFRWLKVDPANASGPIGTIIQDVVSVTIYFLIATAVL